MRCLDVLASEVDLSVQEPLDPSDLAAHRRLSKSSRPGVTTGPCSWLTTRQAILLNYYRSEDAIARLFNTVFYDNQLEILTPRDRLELPPELGHSLRWLDCKGVARKIPSGSRVNDDEADLVVRTAVRLLNWVADTDLTLGVVTPFSAQQDAIHRRLLRRVSPDVVERHRVQVLTAHKFQGSEKDLMIASLVMAARGNGSSDRWFDIYPQILNVALSRARRFLCVVGDKEFCRSRRGILGRLVAGFDEIEAERQQDAATLGHTLDSPAERELFDWLLRAPLAQLGYRLVPKLVVKRYTLDFALVGPTRIDVECDGLQHEMVGGMPVIEDVERDAFLMAEGWRVVRVPNHRIWTEPEAVVRKIIAVAQASPGNGRVLQAKHAGAAAP